MSVFSPLALTQALPFLPLAQGDIDYEVSRRDEPARTGSHRGLRQRAYASRAIARRLRGGGTAHASDGARHIPWIVWRQTRRTRGRRRRVSRESRGDGDRKQRAYGRGRCVRRTARTGSESVEIVAGKRCGTIRLGRSARIRTACQRARSRPGHDGDLAGRMACAPTSLPHMRRSDRTGVGRMGATLQQRSGRQATAVPQSGTGRHHGDRGP